jgi:plasmid stability protein
MKPASPTRSPRAPQRLRNFHLPLPERVYEALRREAAALGKPTTVIAREVIEAWLHERRRTMVHEAIAAYAVQHAGSSVDLDPALEKAALEVWRAKKPRR